MNSISNAIQGRLFDDRRHIFVLAVILVSVIYFSPTAIAYENYDDGCGSGACHGEFKSGDYTSNKDGTDWGTDLMSGHLEFIAGAAQDDCDTCHTSGGKSPTPTNASANTDKPQGCVGCHGRTGDESGICAFGLPDSDNEHCGSAAGLRKQHEAAGGTCWACHSAENDTLILVGEDEAPFNYGRVDIALTNSCVNENQFGPTGLDNDGDGAVDGADSDCAPVPILACTGAVLCGLTDVNSNDSADIAVLLVDMVTGNSIVHVRDGMTDASISTLNFGAVQVDSLQAISDINGNGAPEIAAMATLLSGQVRVQIRDSLTGGKINNVFYGTQYSGVDMAVLPDTDSNGADELVVVGATVTGAVRVQARDALSDAATSTTYYGNQAVPISIAVLPDVSGGGAAEMVMHGIVNGSNQSRSQIRDSVTGLVVRNIFYGDFYVPVRVSTIGDITGDGIPELAELGVAASGAGRVRIKNAATGDHVTNAFIGSDPPIAVVGIEDANTDGTRDIAVLVDKAGLARVSQWSGLTGDFIANVFFSTAGVPAALTLVEDIDTNGEDEFAVLGNNAGQDRVKIKNTIAGTQVNDIDFP